MDSILLFFVFPLTTIVIAIALQRLLDNPLLVGAIAFSIFLLVSYISYSGSSQAIIASIVYGILAFLAAYLSRLISNLRNNGNINSSQNGTNNNNSNGNTNANGSGNNSSNNTINNSFPNTNACRTCRCQRNICNGLRM